MQEEYDAQIKKGTWSLVPRQNNVHVMRSMWIHRYKYDSEGNLVRHKSCLMTNGRSQPPDIDCDETFRHMVKPETIRLVLDIALSKNWPLHQLDVQNAFLNGDLQETIYMHQPSGFKDETKPDHVCLLHKVLYCLKQTLRVVPAICYFYYTSGFQTEIRHTDLGKLHYFLGITIKYNNAGLFLQQKTYAMEILQRANMSECNSCTTPADDRGKLSDEGSPPMSDPTLYRSLAGALQYLTFTRPDIAFAVQQVCLFMHALLESHYNALKRILRYIKGTLDHSLQLTPNKSHTLTACSDADWAGCPNTRQSTLGYCIFHGDNLISWSSKRQQTFSRSSAEAEYCGVGNSVSEVSWIRNLMLELYCPLRTVTIVYSDN
ncbi:PREDICTED: uncharacterized mitochondrial protein AtMg00810-like, partial [Brassica oleracea var. oleracea]|uniref:uncharacterized mitochondrial protein AtMg00810-like n=1 Tax=Brassica oleracea var. oleracea TaxID=109376 RepID=UPI0006A6E424